MKRILVTAYTAFNLGDDLFLKILFERYPNVQFVLFTPNHNYIKHLEKYNNVQVDYFSVYGNIILKIVKKLAYSRPRVLAFTYILLLRLMYKKSLDAYLEIGGSIFIQRIKKLSFKEYKNTYLSSWFKNKRAFIVGANWGPCITKEFKTFYANLFRSFTDICFRDIWSYTCFSDLTNVRYERDIAFQLHIPKVTKEANSVGISVIDLTNREALSQYEDVYMNRLSKLVHIYLSKKKKLYLISFCASEGDESAIYKVKSSLSDKDKEKVNLLLYKGDLDLFLDTYSRIELIFATRLHSMILGFICEQKVFPLIYSEKMRNVIEDVKFNGNYCYIEDLFKRKAEDIIDQAEMNEALILNEEAESAQRQFSELDKFLLDE